MATSRAQSAKPSPPNGWSDAPAGIGYGRPPAATTESIARCQLSRTPMSKPASSRRTSPPMMRVSWMFPTTPYIGSPPSSTQRSCTVTHPRPRWRATPVTWRVWFDCTPPIDTSVSQPWSRASATRYSSLRTLLPPKAIPELQSSRLAQISTSPPRASLRRRSGWMGDGPKRSGTRGKSSSAIAGRVRTARLHTSAAPAGGHRPALRRARRTVRARARPASPR